MDDFPNLSFIAEGAVEIEQLRNTKNAPLSEITFDKTALIKIKSISATRHKDQQLDLVLVS